MSVAYRVDLIADVLLAEGALLYTIYVGIQGLLLITLSQMIYIYWWYLFLSARLILEKLSCDIRITIEVFLFVILSPKALIAVIRIRKVMLHRKKYKNVALRYPQRLSECYELQWLSECFEKRWKQNLSTYFKSLLKDSKSRKW